MVGYAQECVGELAGLVGGEGDEDFVAHAEREFDFPALGDTYENAVLVFVEDGKIVVLPVPD